MNRSSKKDLLNDFLTMEDAEQEAADWLKNHGNEVVPPMPPELSKRITLEVRRQKRKNFVTHIGIKKLAVVAAAAMICLSATAVAIGPKLHNFYYKQLEHSVTITG